MSGTAFAFIRIDVPHPECGKVDLQLLRDLVSKDSTICGYCGGEISLNTESWQSVLREASQLYKEIKFIKRG